MTKEHLILRVFKKPFRVTSRSLRLRKRRKKIIKQSKQKGPRIFYMLTPPPRLKNIGDHAQAVAIHEWLTEKAPDYNIIELTKDDVTDQLSTIIQIIKADDKIAIHSGGNFGDRGIWSESLRRKIVKYFPGNKIVSLPQTIYFHETEIGQRELENSKAAYKEHTNFTIVARDKRSNELAMEYFPSAYHIAAPDFVLRYQWRPTLSSVSNGRVLLCLRQDNESALGNEDIDKLQKQLELPVDNFDTTLEYPIQLSKRKPLLHKTLTYFSRYDAIITDRFHGLIFAILTERPTVVLPTVDHKLTSAFDWFGFVHFVAYCDDVDNVPSAYRIVTATSKKSVPSWDELYFDTIAKILMGKIKND